MKKFLLVRDYKANSATERSNPFDYDVIEAASVYEAIDIAEKLYIDDTVYLSILCEKSGNVKKGDFGEKVTTYQSVLAKRSNGWNRTNAAHSEQETVVQVHTFSYGSTYELVH